MIITISKSVIENMLIHAGPFLEKKRYFTNNISCIFKRIKL